MVHLQVKVRPKHIAVQDRLHESLRAAVHPALARLQVVRSLVSLGIWGVERKTKRYPLSRKKQDGSPTCCMWPLSSVMFSGVSSLIPIRSTSQASSGALWKTAS